MVNGTAMDGGRPSRSRLRGSPSLPALGLWLVAATVLGTPARGAAEGTPCAISVIAEGQPAQGVLDETDCPSSQQGGRFLSDRHQFTAWPVSRS